jgi:hypothetical protein
MRGRLLAVTAALIALIAAPASASERKVPRAWLGVDADGPVMEGAYGTPDGEWDLMAASGAESVRMAVRWYALQPNGDMPPDLGPIDQLVLAAARRGLTFLPVVHGTPRWAAQRPSKGSASPPRVGAYTRFLGRLVERYGPKGSLWAEHPEVTAQPVRDWQIWNEPNFREFWSTRPFAKSFVKLMRAARKTLRRADPRSRVILAGMANWSWHGLERLYEAGGRKTFDAVALHPYTAKPGNVVRLVRFARDVMRRHGDGRKPVWITELSFPAAKGKVNRPYGFETTQAGQVRRLRAGLLQLAAERRRLRIERVYWYAWLTHETRTSSFSWSGLRRMRDGEVVSSSALGAFKKVARRLQGCSKPLGDARRCR